MRANRWFLYGPFLVAALALAAWFPVWRAGAGTMREALADFAAAQATRGAVVDYAPLRARGFPFFLRGVVDGFSLRTDDGSYSCSRLFIDALPYQLDRIVFSCGGDQRATVDGRDWKINAADARASIEQDRDRGWIIRSETGAFKAEGSGESYSAQSVMLNLAPGETDSAVLDISFRAVGGAMSTAPEFEIARIDAALKINQPDAFGRRRIDVLGLEALINGSALTARGALYEQAGAYEGRLDAELEKPVGLARAGAALGLLTPDETRAAEAGLAMLAVAAGGKIAAPIIIQDETVSLAGVTLGRSARADQP